MCFEGKGYVMDRKRSIARASGWSRCTSGSLRRSGWCDPVVRRATQPSTCAALQWLPPIGYALLIAVIACLTTASAEGAGTGRIAFEDLVETGQGFIACGVQARTNLAAIMEHFEVAEVRAYSRRLRTAKA